MTPRLSFPEMVVPAIRQSGQQPTGPNATRWSGSRSIPSGDVTVRTGEATIPQHAEEPVPVSLSPDTADHANPDRRFRELMLPHLDAAYNLARYLLRDPVVAEDIAQDAFLRAFRAFDGYRGGDPKAWILTIVRNCCHSWAKTAASDQTVPLEGFATDRRGDPGDGEEYATGLVDSADTPEAAVVRHEEIAAMRELIENLPLTFRETLVLREIEELSYQEIASATQAPIGTVMSRLARARHLLRGCLAPADRRRRGDHVMTLPCSDMAVLLHGHLDNQLDAAHALQVENHLRSCQACAREYQRLLEFRAALDRDALRYRAPDALRARILSTLASETGSMAATIRIRWWQRLWQVHHLGLPVAAFAAGLAVALILPRQSLDLEQELVSEHVRSLMANHITDVTTSDQHTVKPWFDGRLDFAPPVVDLAGEGFALTGGRLDYIGGRAVAALVYKRRMHILNLFVWPVEKSGTSIERAQASIVSGYNTLRWSGGGMTFWVVSDVNADELQEFMHRLQDHIARQ